MNILDHDPFIFRCLVILLFKAMAVPSGKTCFVTVGATAAFTELVHSVLTVPFLTALRLASYDQLRIQYGKDGQAAFHHFLAKHGVSPADASATIEGISIHGFDFRHDGLAQEMAYAKNRGGDEGAVISHAGMELESIRQAC